MKIILVVVFGVCLALAGINVIDRPVVTLALCILFAGSMEIIEARAISRKE